MEEILKKVTQLVDQKKANDITVYKFKEENIIADSVLIFSAQNTIHCKALVETVVSFVEDYIKQNKNNEIFCKKSGEYSSGWVILDLNVLIIHCIIESNRKFYNVDKYLETKSTVYHY